MTARRRRKPGSGPPATALIAWVGGAGVGTDHQDNAAYPGIPAPSAAAAIDGCPPLVGRARGLAVGTLLACGSVLAVAVHAADSSGPQEPSSSGLFTAGPGAVSGGYSATPRPVSSAAAPAVTSAQSVARTDVRPGVVHRNAPQSVDVPRAAPIEPQRPAPLAMPGADRGPSPERDPVRRAVAPVADPVTQAPKTVVAAAEEMITPRDRTSTPTSPLVQQVVPAAQDVVSPVGDVLTSVGDVVAPLQEGAQPAMAMLSPLSLG
ncbi:MAG: hypothetical protein ACRDTE_09540 [Pseudonocardiaceae bacterium]